MTTYDSIPYPSYAHPQTSPARLNGIAKLFGLTPVDFSKAKVLEIGCASGGNLLPLAARFPEAEFVGIDLSNAQIDTAKSNAEVLELSNIKFIANSIVEHNFKKEKFDYIIAHGIYAWVPNNVQHRILEICGNHLSMNGVAFISYNTLPGWNAVKTIRDMMLYHGQNFADPSQKVFEARNMLKFVSENMKMQTGPYKETLETEIQTLQNVNDNYLLHDHLEAINEPLYFHEFASRAKDHGLSYLADTSLQSMYLGNQNENVLSTLSQIDDPIRQEQYLDFINNRRFRSSLLVNIESKINRNITPERMEGLRLIPHFHIDIPLNVAELENIDELKLKSFKNSGHTATLKGRVICKAFIEIMRGLPNYLTVEDIIAKTTNVVKDLEPEVVERELKGSFPKLVFSGIFSVTTDRQKAETSISEKPSAFRPAILQGQSMDLIPNLNHEMVKLGADQRLVLQYVNGKNTIDQICDALKSHIEKGELTLNVDGAPLEVGSDTFEDSIKQYMQGVLQVFAQNALLVA